MGTEVLVFWPDLFEGGQTVLLLKVVNAVPELLVLGFAAVDCGVVEVAMQSTPAVEHRNLLAGWIEPKSDAANYSHNIIIAQSKPKRPLVQ